MYLISVVLLMAVFPLGSIALEYLYHPEPFMFLVGRWFVFWGVGVRLTLAGLKQISQPRFTAEKIFHIKGEEALPIVQELGIANLSKGVVGLASIVRADFLLPIAILATLFYGIAGVRHAMDKGRSRNQNIAMVSDVLVALIYLAYLGSVAFG